MRKLRFSDDAKADIAAIVYRIATDKPAAARKWKMDLQAKCRGLLNEKT